MAMAAGRWWAKPFYQGFLLLLILITLFLSKPLFSGQPLLAADLLFYLDPLWQPLAPPGFDAPANQVLSDQIFEFYPWQQFIRAELAAGRLPLWNPYANSGHPLLANAQAALFDPFNAVARLWPLAQSFAVIAFLRLLCAGTFTLLLALALGLSRFAAYLAMVVFTFALPQVVWLLYPKASVLVWLPAMLFLTLRLIRTGSWRDVVALALVMAAQLVGGHPETALYNALLWLFFSGYWLWLEAKMQKGEAQSGMMRARIVQLATAALLGLGAGAVQWLPVAEVLLQSEILAARSQPALTWQGTFFQWRDWLAAPTMLLPDFYGNPRHHNYWFPYSNYTEQTLYVGLLPLSLAVVALLQKGRGRQLAFFAALALFCLGMALRLPLFPLLAEAPILNVTNPNRLRGIYTLAVALLAGYGLDLVRRSMASGGAPQHHKLLRVLAVLAAFATLIVAGAYFTVTRFREQFIELGRAQAVAAQGNPFFFRPLEEYWALAETRVEQIIASFQPTNWTMYLPLLLALGMWGVSAILWRVVRQNETRVQLFSGLVVAAVVGELWLFGFDYNPTTARELVYPTPEAVDYLLQQEASTHAPYRVVGIGLALVPNVSMVFGLEDVRGYDPIAPRRYMEVVSALAGAVRVGHHLLFTNVDAPFLDFLNVRYAFATDAPAGRWTPLRQWQGVTLYANEEAMPRAFMVYAAQHAATPEESLEMTLAPNFDLRNSVISEGDVVPLADAPPARAPVVEITRYFPGEMALHVETSAAGILVVSDPYTSGWVAHMDGREVEILVANHAFRGVPVPVGEHTVTFQYQPKSFLIGAWISGTALLMLSLLWLLTTRIGGSLPQGRVYANTSR